MATRTTEPAEKTATLRGVTYTLREISMAEYDECVLKATETKTNAIGEEVEVTDRGKLLRFMVLKSAGLSPTEFAALKMPTALKLNQLVNDMHYVDELSDEEKADQKKASKNGKTDEGDSSGNAG